MSQLLLGDCREQLQTLSDSSIDAVVTDPPYELGFMGKGWDSSGIAYDPTVWEQCLRVLKPGAYVLAFGGTRTFHRLTCAVEDAGFEIRDVLSWLYGTGLPKNKNLGNGKGTTLKPAWEPIVMARKPFKGTVTACHRVHGTAALNIDACRIPHNEIISVPQSDPAKRRGVVGTDLGISNASIEKFQQAQRESVQRTQELGRFPANVLLDEEAAKLLDAQSGERRAGGNVTGEEPSESTKNVYGAYERKPWTSYGDSGGASRFFYCAKPSPAERGEGNIHPTVKPVALMSWLVRLVTPLGGTVLDPFAGSGSTGIAALAEGREFIGIDLTPEYVEIAEARIRGVK